MSATLQRISTIDFMLSTDVNELKKALDSGIDIEVPDKDGWTALMYAVCKNKPDIVQFLLDHGANVNAQCDSGWTPLMFAAQGSSLDMVNLVLTANPRLDIKDKSGSDAISLTTEEDGDAVYMMLKAYEQKLSLKARVSDSSHLVRKHKKKF